MRARTVEPSWPKRCACGASWWPSDFDRLRYRGEWELEDGHLELRDCTCGSTIAMPSPRFVPSYARACERAQRLREEARALILMARTVRASLP